VGRLADYHFVPTERARQNLFNEGINKNIWVVGNTVIDALFLGLRIIKEHGEEEYYQYFDFVDFSRKIILVTGHRRESFGEPFKNICFALREIADSFEDVEIVYPVHLNPNVRKPVNEILRSHSRIHLIEPLKYPYLIWLMSKSYLILTDSGGMQEEAPSLGKPVLVMRDVTERVEGIEAGTAILVGTDKDRIVAETSKLLENCEEYNKMARAVNPYGDGKASQRIVKVVKEEYREI
jgi:UDP-N-acetylglucosamine 2-epimerase (non-hydrolysing)